MAYPIPALAVTLAIASVMGGGAVAQPAVVTSQQSVARVLGADQAAPGAVSVGGAVESQYVFTGIGLTGSATSLTDLEAGRFVDTLTGGPASQVRGFDGARAWLKDLSGAVTQQDGGEQYAMAVNAAYRRANLWWRADRGGAAIVSQGVRQDNGGNTYEVLEVTPRGGKTFEAWFDATTHRLARVIEKPGAQTISISYSDYRSVEGVVLPGKTTIDDGAGAKYVQVLTLVSARFEDEPPASAFAAPKIALADFAIADGATETVLPFRLINNHVYAQAWVNGAGPFFFLFDTGGMNLVTPATAKAIGLNPQGRLDAHGAGEGVMDVGFAKVAELKLAQANITDQVFLVLALDAFSDVDGIDEKGMVGYETFRRFVTRIDYGARTVTLIDPKHFDPRGAGTPIHFDFGNHDPEVAGAFEGIPGRFRVDTGSRSEVTLNKPFSDRNALRAKHPKGVDAMDGWGVGGATRAYVVRGASLTLGPVEVKGVVASLSTQTKGAFAGDDYQGSIGGGFLKRFVVTFDYDHQIIYLKPLAQPGPDAGTYDRAGMWFNVAGDGFKVVDVTPTGPAEGAGFKVGDQIIAIDGKGAKAVAVYDLRRRLRNSPPGTVVTFKVLRDGQARDLKVTLRDLI